MLWVFMLSYTLPYGDLNSKYIYLSLVRQCHIQGQEFFLRRDRRERVRLSRSFTTRSIACSVES